jgi:phage baseplate assembly protein W
MIPNTTTIYGKVPSSKVISKVTSKNNKITGIAFPSKNTKGYFSKLSGEALYKSNTRNLLMTMRGERFMLPNYGCNLKKFLMEQIDETTFNDIKKEVTESISKYLEFIQLKKIQVFQSKSFPKTLNVGIFCSVVDEAEIVFDVNVRV